jgi:hypothetical protein
MAQNLKFLGEFGFRAYWSDMIRALYGIQINLKFPLKLCVCEKISNTCHKSHCHFYCNDFRYAEYLINHNVLYFLAVQCEVCNAIIFCIVQYSNPSL